MEQETVTLEATVVEPAKVIDVEPTVPGSNNYAPRIAGPVSDVQAANEDMEGLDSLRSFLPRVSLAQGVFTYKNGPKKDQAVPSLAIKILSGRACLEFYDENGEYGNMKAWYTSYDGGRTTDKNEPCFPGYLKVARQKYEIEWEEPDPTNEANIIKYQMSLPPVGAGTFKDYIVELKRRCDLGVKQVTTLITSKTAKNAGGKIYSTHVWTCNELEAARSGKK